MTVKEFEVKYGDKGGIQKLSELRSLFANQGYIASHFGVSRERVRQWMLEFFGNSYDPRMDRKEVLVAGMVEFAKNNPKKDFRIAFSNTEYYREALEMCINKKIYE